MFDFPASVVLVKPQSVVARQVRRSDVRSAWSGIRPLAVDPSAKDTASALRDHIVHVDTDGLVTVTGARPSSKGPSE